MIGVCLGEEGPRLAGCFLELGLLPLICVSGVILNLVCLWVFIGNRKHPLVPALAMLCICDFAQLFLSLFVFFLPAVHDYHRYDQYGLLAQVAYLSTGLLAPLLLTSNCASIWTICYISIRRHRAVLNPLSVRQSTVTWKPLAVIGVVALLFNTPGWFEREWLWANATEAGTEYFLMYQMRPFASDPSELYKHNMLYPICVYLIPLILLVGLSLRILTNMSSRPCLTNDLDKRMAQERRGMTLLISIVILFFVCHTGGLVYRFVHWDEKSEEHVKYRQIFIDLVNLLFNINSFANPLLYFFFTRQFRDIRVSFIAARFSGREFSKLRGSEPVSVKLLPPCSFAQLTRQPRGSVPLLFF